MSETAAPPRRFFQLRVTGGNLIMLICACDWENKKYRKIETRTKWTVAEIIERHNKFHDKRI